MSIFAVNYLCREVLRDHAFRAAMKADPAKALAPLDLTDEERRALVAGDVGSALPHGRQRLPHGLSRPLRSLRNSISRSTTSACAP